MDKFTVEKVMKIWDDKVGEYLQIGPDGDGLGLLDLQYVDVTGKINSRIVLPREMLLVVARVILDNYSEESA